MDVWWQQYHTGPINWLCSGTSTATEVCGIWFRLTLFQPSHLPPWSSRCASVIIWLLGRVLKNSNIFLFFCFYSKCSQFPLLGRTSRQCFFCQTWKSSNYSENYSMVWQNGYIQVKPRRNYLGTCISLLLPKSDVGIRFKGSALPVLDFQSKISPSVSCTAHITT
jgi:hypothetical protein